MRIRYFITLVAIAIAIICAGIWARTPAAPDWKPFVLPTPDILISTGLGNVEATELWVENPATGEINLLIRGKADDDMRRVVAGICDPRVSPDGAFIYFNSAAWATSAAVHRISIHSREHAFVIDGEACGFVASGPWKDALFVIRAIIKHDANGESLGRDSYLWVIPTDGRASFEVGADKSPESDAFVRQFGCL
jgi:hypothetical protein